MSRKIRAQILPVGVDDYLTNEREWYTGRSHERICVRVNPETIMVSVISMHGYEGYRSFSLADPDCIDKAHKLCNQVHRDMLRGDIHDTDTLDEFIKL